MIDRGGMIMAYCSANEMWADDDILTKPLLFKGNFHVLRSNLRGCAVNEATCLNNDNLICGHVVNISQNFFAAVT